MTPPVRLAVLGLGEAARRLHLPACAGLEGATLVGACDPDPARREWARRHRGIRAVYDAALPLLAEQRPDVVVVATPPDSHRDLCLLALAHGAHVLCEKPFALTVAQADEILAEAERRARTVVVNNQYGLMPLYRIPRERIAAGAFGRPFLIQCWQQMLPPPPPATSWRARLGRATLLEFGTHPLDLICGFFDALPVSVTACMPRIGPETPGEVVVQAALRYPAERLATVILNRASRAPRRYLEMRIDCPAASVRISFGGVARARLEWSPPLRRPTLQLSAVRGGEARVEADGRSRVLVRARVDGRPAATAAHLRSVVEAARRGRAWIDQARRARDVLRIVEAAYDSARTGETAWLDAADRPPASSRG